MRRALVGVIAATALAIGVLGCGGGDSDEPAGAAPSPPAATGTTPTSATAPSEAAVEVTDIGFVPIEGGLYVGALVENAAAGDAMRVEVALELLDARGAVVAGAGEPIDLGVIPRGQTVAAAAGVSGSDCACDLEQVERVRPRVTVGGVATEGVASPAALSELAFTAEGGRLVVTGTVQNDTGLTLDEFTRLAIVALDAQGRVMGGAVALLGLEIPEGGTAAFEVSPPASFLPALPRAAAQVRVSVLRS